MTTISIKTRGTTMKTTRNPHALKFSLGATSLRSVATTISALAMSLATTVCFAGPIQNDQIGNWGFDTASGTTATDTVNGNNGTWQTAGGLAWVPGQIGNAADLTGANSSNQRFDIASIPQMAGATALTMSGWIDIDSVPGYKGVLMTRDVTDSSGGGKNWGLAVEPTNHVDGRANVGGLDSAANSLSNGTWAHVAVVWDSSLGSNQAKLYLDGVQIDSQNSGITSITSSGQWNIGQDVFSASRYYDGQVDDIAIWDRALTAAEVAAVHDSGTDSISATRAFHKANTSIQNDGMIANWTMDQATYSPAANDSKNSNDATLTNMDSATDWISGKIGGALDFDGNNDYAVTGPNIGDGATALTMSVWVKADSTSNWDGFITSTGDFFGLQMDNTTVTPGHDIHFRAMGAALYTDSAIQIGEWVHYAGVWESGTTFEVYENGVLIASGAAPGGVADIDNWFLGSDRMLPNDGGRYFNGQLDDAALWTRALHASEIRGLYLDGLAGLNASQAAPAPAPEPSAIVLSMMGIMAMGLVRRRRVARS